MGKDSKIGWTATILPDGRILPGYTFNAWIGCTKISQGCKFCYAERQNEFRHWNPAGWGPGVPRKRTSKNYWRQPFAWAADAVEMGILRRVFGGSLCDPFDVEVSPDWRIDYWDLLARVADATKALTGTDWNGIGLEWLILTKRPDNIAHMLPPQWLDQPPAWLRLGVTVEDADNTWRADALLDAWNGKNFISCEPLIGPVSLEGWMRRLHWVIVGAESGHHPGIRRMDLAWVVLIQEECAKYNVPFFFKQMRFGSSMIELPPLNGTVWAQFPQEPHHG